MKRFLSIVITLFTSMAFGNPLGIHIAGRIVDDATDVPLSGPVSFRIRVLTKNNCVLYSELFNAYTVPATGTFSFVIGQGTSPLNAFTPGNPVAAQSLQGLNDVFSNSHAAPVATLAEGAASGSPTASDNVACGGAGVPYTPTADDVRKVRIDFDTGDGLGYKSIIPYHQIRSVPYAMLAEEAGNALKLGGAVAADYAKLTDLPDLATGVPAAETDPSVKAFAKATISNLTAGACAAGQVLSYNGTALVCVVDGGSGSATPIATATVVGTVMVPAASYVSLAGTGEIDVEDLPISKITNLQTALNDMLKVSDMPGTTCAAGEALIWSSPANVFSCNAITINAAHVSDFDTAVDARITAGGVASPKLPLAGGTMTGDITMGSHDVLASGHITMSSQKTITIGKYDQTQENTLAGTLLAANEGATWYNSAMKALRFWDGTARQTIVSTTATCADTQILKWNDTTKVWACAADAGAGGADASSIQGTAVDAVAPTTTGQMLRFNSVSGKWEASAIQNGDLPSSIARVKIALGTLDHVLINDGTGALSSEAQLAVSRGGTGQSTYTDGQMLIGKTDGTLAKTTLTAGTGVTVTNGDGIVTIAATSTSNITDGTIIDADVNAAAAIARTKLADGTANRVLINDASGVMADAAAITANRALASDANGIPTHTAVSSTELGYVSGVSSAIQTQLNAKTSSTGWTNFSVIGVDGTGTLTAYPGSSSGSLINWTVTGPAWTTAVFPNSTTANQLLYSSANNVVGGLATANNAVLTTNGTGVPSWSTTSTDFLSQYALLAGRATGQTLKGGTAASENLVLDSTANATKGVVSLQPGGGTVTVGTTTIASGALHVAHLPSSSVGGVYLQNSNADNHGGELTFVKSRGTAAVPASMSANDRIMGLYAMGLLTGGATTSNVGAIEVLAAEGFTGAAQGTYMKFGTTPVGTTTRLDRMTIAEDGNVGIGTTNPVSALHVVGRSGVNGVTGTAAPDGLTITAGAGGNSSGANTPGAVGGNITISAGKGGNSTGVGGIQGGYVNIQGGAGGTGSWDHGYGPIYLNANGGAVVIGDEATVGAFANLTVNLNTTTGYVASSVADDAPTFAQLISNSWSNDNNTSLIGFNVVNSGSNWGSAYMGALAGSVNYSPAMVFGQQTGANSYRENMRILGSGYVGIGNTVPTKLLHVGSATVTTGTAVANFQNIDGTCTITPAAAGSGIACSSDERLKENFNDVTGDFALNKILQLQAVTYNFKTSSPENRRTGYKAQEVQKIAPEFVRQNDDGYLQVYYDAFIPWITEAIKSVVTIQAREIASIKIKAEKMAAENAALKAQAAKSEKENAEIKAYLCKRDPSAAFCH